MEEVYLTRQQMLQALQSLFCKLRQYYRLLVAIFAVFLLFVLLIYLFMTPKYMAVAVVGPANPSPSSQMMANSGSSSVSSSLMRRLSGGGGSSNDPFLEYLQLLKSSQLATQLVKKDNLLPVVFYKSWDAKNKKGIVPSNPLHGIASEAKRALQRPIFETPDSEMLMKHLDKTLNISTAESSAADSSLSDGNYIKVTYTSDDPYRAQYILNVILKRSDEIIRQERLMDVNARIKYIKDLLPSVEQTEQKMGLIQILSNQEELLIMLVADQRFSTTLIDAPYASKMPIWPGSPKNNVILSFFLSVSLWIVLVAIENKIRFLHKILSVFRSKG